MNKKLLIMPLTFLNQNKYSIIDLINEIDFKTFNIDLLVIDTTDETRINRILVANEIPYLKTPFATTYLDALQTGLNYACENGYDFAIEFDPSGRVKSENINYVIKTFETNNLDILTTTRFDLHNKKGRRTIRAKMLRLAVATSLQIKIMDIDNPLKIYGKNTLKHFYDDDWYQVGPTTLPHYIKSLDKDKFMEVHVSSDHYRNHTFTRPVKHTRDSIKEVLTLLFVIPFRRRKKND